MDTTTYKTLTVVLLIVALVLGYLLYQEKNEPLENSLADSTAVVEECNERIAEWRAENGNNVAAADADAQADLEVILEDCLDDVE